MVRLEISLEFSRRQRVDDDVMSPAHTYILDWEASDRLYSRKYPLVAIASAAIRGESSDRSQRYKTLDRACSVTCGDKDLLLLLERLDQIDGHVEIAYDILGRRWGQPLRE